MEKKRKQNGMKVNRKDEEEEYGGKGGERNGKREN